MQAERISLGEEVDYRYVSSALQATIEQWNQAVSMVTEKRPEELLKLLNMNLREDDPETHLNEICERLEKELCPISLKPTSANFLLLGLIPLIKSILCGPNIENFHDIYIYYNMYIYNYIYGYIYIYVWVYIYMGIYIYILTH